MTLHIAPLHSKSNQWWKLLNEQKRLSGVNAESDDIMRSRRALLFSTSWTDQLIPIETYDLIIMNPLRWMSWIKQQFWLAEVSEG